MGSAQQPGLGSTTATPTPTAPTTSTVTIPASPIDWDKKLKRLMRWLIFTACIGVVPVAIKWVLVANRSTNNQVEWALAGGELLLISVVLAGDGIGAVVATNEEQAIPKMLLSGTGFILALLTSVWFAVIATKPDSALTMGDAQGIANGSVAIFACSVGLSVLCKLLGDT